MSVEASSAIVQSFQARNIQAKQLMYPDDHEEVQDSISAATKMKAYMPKELLEYLLRLYRSVEVIWSCIDSKCYAYPQS